MSKPDPLAEELCWQSDGHASDLVVSMMADGQHDLVPNQAALHVDECLLCTDRMVEMASLSLSMGEDLRGLSFQPTIAITSRSPGRAARPSAFPRRFFALALALAALGALPELWAMQDAIPYFAGIGHDLLALLRGLRVVGALFVDQVGGLLLILSFFSTLLCIAGGWLVARTVPPHLLKGHSR